MKLIIATPFYPPERGVLGQYAEGIIGAAQKAGIEVKPVVFSRFAHLPPLLRHLRYALELYREGRGADLMLALDTASVGLPALLAAKVAGTRLAVRIGGDFLWERYVERVRKPVRLSEVYSQAEFTLTERLIFWLTTLLVRQAEHVLFTTHFQRDLWQRVYGIPHERVHLFENIYPVPSNPLPPRGKVFISAGRGIYLKNYEMLERVFAQVKEAHPDIELDTRPLSHADHIKRLSTCYAVIIPSISEVNSNTAIEAVAHGKPFIMSSDTGTKERLAQGALYIDTRSEVELRHALESLLYPDMYEQLVAQVRAHTFVRTFDDLVSDLKALV